MTEGEHHSLLGQWWLPASPERKLPGSVDPAERHPTLRILGTFDPENTRFAFAYGDTKYDVLHGHAQDQDYTIVDAEGSTLSASRTDPSEEIHVRGYIAVGAHLQDPDAEFVERIRVEAHGLGHWLGAGPESMDESTVGDDAGVTTYTVGTRVPTFPSFEVLPGVWLGSAGRADRRLVHTPSSSIAEFTGSASLWLRYDEPTSFRIASEHARIALDLVTMLSGDTAWQTGKEIKVTGTDNWIRIIEPGRPVFDGNTDDPRVRQLLHSSDIALSTLFTGWFRLNVEDGRSGINVLLAGTYKDNAYVETDLQNTMTATDVLYRRLADRNPALPKKVPLTAEAMKLITDAEAVLPSHLRGALRSKKAREVNAFERLSYLLEWVGPANFSTVVPVDNQAAWVTLAKDARNDITHDGTFTKHVDVPGLMAMSFGLRWLLTLAILRDIGYPPDRLGSVRGKQRNEAEYTTREYLLQYLAPQKSG